MNVPHPQLQMEKTADHQNLEIPLSCIIIEKELTELYQETMNDKINPVLTEEESVISFSGTTEELITLQRLLIKRHRYLPLVVLHDMASISQEVDMSHGRATTSLNIPPPLTIRSRLRLINGKLTDPLALPYVQKFPCLVANSLKRATIDTLLAMYKRNTKKEISKRPVTKATERYLPISNQINRKQAIQILEKLPPGFIQINIYEGDRFAHIYFIPANFNPDSPQTTDFRRFPQKEKAKVTSLTNLKFVMPNKILIELFNI